MDINLVRSVLVVIGLLLFMALVVWTYRKSRRRAFDDAAQLPFIDDESNLQTTQQTSRRVP